MQEVHQPLKRKAIVCWYSGEKGFGRASLLDKESNDTGKRVYISASAARKQQWEGQECIFGSQGRMPQRRDCIWVELKWTNDWINDPVIEILRWYFPDLESITERGIESSDRFRMIECEYENGSRVGILRERFEGTLDEMLASHPRERDDTFLAPGAAWLFRKQIPEIGKWVECEDPRPLVSGQRDLRFA